MLKKNSIWIFKDREDMLRQMREVWEKVQKDPEKRRLYEILELL